MKLRIAFFALAALGGVALTSTAVSAMPNGLSTPDQIVGQTSDVQEARWICPPGGRCFWRPGHWRGAFGMRRPWGWRHRRWW